MGIIDAIFRQSSLPHRANSPTFIDLPRLPTDMAFRYMPTLKSPPSIRITCRGAGTTTTARRTLASGVARSGHKFMREMNHHHLPSDWVVIVIVTLALAVFAACCWPWARIIWEATR